MKKLFLFISAIFMSLYANSQCQASFTNNINAGDVSFTNTSTGSNLGYSWDFGDGGSSSQQNPSHTYSSTGGYIVCLTVYSNDSLNPNGCQDTYCDSIYVTVPQDTTGGNCQAYFTWNGGGTPNINFYDGSSGSNLGYAWDFGDGSTSSSANPSHTYTGTGSYQVCLTIYSQDSLNSCQDTYCSVVNVPQDSTGGNGNCQAYFTWSANTTTVTYTDGSGGANLGYSWDLGDGNTSSQENPSHTYASSGTYQVCLTIFSQDSTGSCQDTYCQVVNIYSDTTGNDSTANLNIIDLDDLLSAYPNPATDKITVEVNDSQVDQLVITDLYGREMETILMTSEKTLIDLNNYPNGLYLIHALGQSGKRLTSNRFMKR